MFKKIKNNKILNLIGNILYTLLVLLVVLILITVVLQRASNNNLSLGGYRIFNIVTGSMFPKYEVGDVLVSKTISPSEIKKEDDITYLGKEGDFAGKIVTHQVIDIENENGNYKFHTKGLANTEEDPIVGQDQVVGKIIYKVKTLSVISKIIQNLYSLYFVIFIPVALLVFIEIRRIIIDLIEDKKSKQNEKKENNGNHEE
jgi:signal peptidase